ncbi:MAG: hypothetical protein NTZ87_04440 [Candidatus Nomurabacteria bacterium]|nr:hypothetical protein [Candidatus Nomurabacteria bacterium]
MSKRNIIIVVAVVLIILAVGFYFNKKSASNPYSVVYLTTGEVYVGELTTVPDLTLKNGYILQVTKDATDATKNTFQLNPISQALWAPKVLHLVKDNVVFYGPLMSTSKIAQTLAGQAK